MPKVSSQQSKQSEQNENLSKQEASAIVELTEASNEVKAVVETNPTSAPENSTGGVHAAPPVEYKFRRKFKSADQAKPKKSILKTPNPYRKILSSDGVLLPTHGFPVGLERENVGHPLKFFKPGAYVQLSLETVLKYDDILFVCLDTNRDVQQHNKFLQTGWKKVEPRKKSTPSYSNLNKLRCAANTLPLRVDTGTQVSPLTGTVRQWIDTDCTAIEDAFSTRKYSVIVMPRIYEPNTISVTDCLGLYNSYNHSYDYLVARVELLKTRILTIHDQQVQDFEQHRKTL